MSTFLQTLVTGLAVGSLYALIALGYTMVYGVLGFINFAHGDVFMVGAWLSLALAGAAAAGELTPFGDGGLAVGGVALGAAVIAGALLLGLRRWEGGPRRAALIKAPAGRVFWAGAAVAALIAVVYGGGALATLTQRHVPAGATFLPGVIALLTAMAACAVLGVSIERAAYHPLRNAPRLNVLITAIGVSLLIENTGQLGGLFGKEPGTVPEAMLAESTLLTLAGVRVTNHDAAIFAAALALMGCLDYLVFRTRLGLSMRAVAFDRRLASLMGVHTGRVVSLTFAVGSALAAAGGFLFAAKYRILNQPADMGWVLLGLKAFVAAVVGGIGNVRGAMVGGLLIGLIENFGAQYLSSDLRDAYVFALLILVLLVKPSGLFGRPVVEKV